MPIQVSSRSQSAGPPPHRSSTPSCENNGTSDRARPSGTGAGQGSIPLATLGKSTSIRIESASPTARQTPKCEPETCYTQWGVRPEALAAFAKTGIAKRFRLGCRRGCLLHNRSPKLHARAHARTLTGPSGEAQDSCLKPKPFSTRSSHCSTVCCPLSAGRSDESKIWGQMPRRKPPNGAHTSERRKWIWKMRMWPASPPKVTTGLLLADVQISGLARRAALRRVCRSILPTRQKVRAECNAQRIFAHPVAGLAYPKTRCMLTREARKQVEHTSTK